MVEDQEALGFMYSLCTLRPDVAWMMIFVTCRLASTEYKQKSFGRLTNDNNGKLALTSRESKFVFKEVHRATAQEVHSISVIYTSIRLRAETKVRYRHLRGNTGTFPRYVFCKARLPTPRPARLSGPRCNNYVSRLFKFLVFFIGWSIFAIKTHQNFTSFSVMGLPPKNLYNKLFENMSIFKIWFTSIQAGNTACNYRTHYHLVLLHKTNQNQGICYVKIAYCYVAKRLWPAINFLMWKWPAILKRLDRPGVRSSLPHAKL